MSNEGLQAKIGRVGISLKGFRVYNQNIVGGGRPDTVLRPTAAAINVPVFCASGKAEPPSDPMDSPRSRLTLRGRNRLGFIVFLHIFG
jgi:hypothetical protein